MQVTAPDNKRFQFSNPYDEIFYISEDRIKHSFFEFSYTIDEKNNGLARQTVYDYLYKPVNGKKSFFRSHIGSKYFVTHDLQDIMTVIETKIHKERNKGIRKDDERVVYIKIENLEKYICLLKQISNWNVTRTLKLIESLEDINYSTNALYIDDDIENNRKPAESNLIEAKEEYHRAVNDSNVNTVKKRKPKSKEKKKYIKNLNFSIIEKESFKLYDKNNQPLKKGVYKNAHYVSFTISKTYYKYCLHRNKMRPYNARLVHQKESTAISRKIVLLSNIYSYNRGWYEQNLENFMSNVFYRPDQITKTKSIVHYSYSQLDIKKYIESHSDYISSALGGPVSVINQVSNKIPKKDKRGNELYKLHYSKNYSIAHKKNTERILWRFLNKQQATNLFMELVRHMDGNQAFYFVKSFLEYHKDYLNSLEIQQAGEWNNSNEHSISDFIFDGLLGHSELYAKFKEAIKVSGYQKIETNAELMDYLNNIEGYDLISMFPNQFTYEVARFYDRLSKAAEAQNKNLFMSISTEIRLSLKESITLPYKAESVDLDILTKVFYSPP